MRVSRRLLTSLSVFAALILSACIAIAAATNSTADAILQKPAAQWSEAEALQVLNASAFAQIATNSTQPAACDYEHPALAGLLSDLDVLHLDAANPSGSLASVPADSSTYVVRLLSARPVQSAAERLISLSPKYTGYQNQLVQVPVLKSEEGKVAKADSVGLISFAIMLQQVGADGRSFRDYAFETTKKGYPALIQPQLWACAGIRTVYGQVHAVRASVAVNAQRQVTGIELSFPSEINGKPLVLKQGETLEFRLVLNQRVFEANFSVNPADLLGLEARTLRFPPTVDQPARASLQ